MEKKFEITETLAQRIANFVMNTNGKGSEIVPIIDGIRGLKPIIPSPLINNKPNSEEKK